MATHHTACGRASDPPLAVLRKVIARLEPWYDWGQTNVWRLDQVERDFSDESESTVRFIHLQWLGISFELRFGRTPPKATRAEVAERKLSIARARSEESA